MGKLFRKLFSVVLATFLIGLVFYRRLLLERIPHEIKFDNYSLVFVFIALIIIASNISVLFHIFASNKPEHSGVWLTKILHSYYFNNSIIGHFLEQVITFLSYCSFRIDSSFRYLANFLESIYIYSYCLHHTGEFAVKLKPNHIAYILFIFNTVPRLAVAIAFFVDVCIFHYFYYFYICVPFLILPFILTLLLEAWKSWANTCRLEIREYVNIEGVVTGTPPEQQYYETKTTWLPNVEQFVTLDFWPKFEFLCVSLVTFYYTLNPMAKSHFLRFVSV